MSLIVSVHVYSVQKALLKDSGPLYSVDYDAVKDNFENCSKYVHHMVSTGIDKWHKRPSSFRTGADM